MSDRKVLVVEDEEDVLELVRYNLCKNGYTVETAKSGEEAISKVESYLPNLIVLDIMLPGMDGLDVCKWLKKNNITESIPVIMMTAKGEESDVVTGLELGADDYVTKPFSPRVLLARVKAVLRRGAGETSKSDGVIKNDVLVIDPSRHLVMVDEKPVDLTVTEFRTLYHLANRPGRVFTRYQIVDAIHGSDYPVTDRSVDVQIVGLRKKLGKAGKIIKTVRGVGYKFEDQT